MLRYAITRRQLFAGKESERLDALVAQARRLAAQGVDLLQIREKDLPERDLESLTTHILEAVREAGQGKPKVLLNGPAHIAVSSGTDGVHLRGGAGAGELRAVQDSFHLAGLEPPLVSVSCHSVAEVHLAAIAGFDFILFGPVFEKRVDGDIVSPGLGLDALHQASRQTRHADLLALGGVTPQNAQTCIDAGAAGIAGIRMFL